MTAVTETDKALAELREPFPELTPDQPNPTTRLRNAPVFARLMHRTTALPSGCWEWRGARNSNGYGNIRRDMGGPAYSVHRVSWEHFNGPIPSDREIDHVCLNRACVNPNHLRLVTRTENVHHGRKNQNDGKEYCSRDHQFTSANTGRDGRGNRTCRACAREATRTYRARKSVAE